MSFSGSLVYGFSNDSGGGDSNRRPLRFFLTSSSTLSSSNDSIISTALRLVLEHIKDEVALEAVSENEYRNGSVDVVINLVSHRDFVQLTREMLNVLPSGLSDLDAFYIERSTVLRPNGQGQIVMNMESILLDNNGYERPDAFYRLVTVFAHELYGNAVRRYFNKEPLSQNPQVNAYQTQVQAYSRGITVIQKIVTYFEGNPDTIPLAIKLKTMIDIEKDRMQSWVRALDSLNENSCKRILTSD